MAPRYRPAIPDKVKLVVVLRQDGKCGCGCGERLGTLANTEFDHCPPLRLRDYDEATRTYTPDANDPDKIVAKIKVHHRDKTNHPLGPHTSAGGDQNMIAKVRPSRAEKFKVNKTPLDDPASYNGVIAALAEKCRSCGEMKSDCICPPPAPRQSAFSKVRR